MSDGTLSHADVLGAVEDRIAATHRLVSVSDLERTLGRPVRRIVDQLVDRKLLSVLFDGPSLPRLVAPRHMFEEALRRQRRPTWAADYSLPGRRELEFRVERDRSELVRLDEVERLLYSTGDSLEDAVATALVVLGFDNVAVTHDSNDCDVRFSTAGLTFLAEAKGKTSQVDKDDVLQLTGWIKQDVETGSEPESLRGVVVANQQRLIAPPERGEPLSQAGDRFARLHEFGVWTAVSLFDGVRAVLQADDPEAVKVRIRAELLAAKYLRTARA